MEGFPVHLFRNNPELLNAISARLNEWNHFLCHVVPVDVWVLIFKHCLDDFQTLSRVCRKWNTIMRKNARKLIHAYMMREKDTISSAQYMTGICLLSVDDLKRYKYETRSMYPWGMFFQESGDVLIYLFDDHISDAKEVMRIKLDGSYTIESC